MTHNFAPSCSTAITTVFSATSVLYEGQTWTDPRFTYIEYTKVRRWGTWGV
jgi:hypothetical protein